MIDCKIYTAFHSYGELLPHDGCYKALQVGKANSKLEIDMADDATGDNISEKNGIYSELTGWYWIWKNQKHDLVGTSHYRRYFTSAQLPLMRKIGKLLLFFIMMNKKRHGLWYVRNVERWKNRILTELEIQVFMRDYDVILPQKKKFKYSVSEQYKRRHNLNDISITREILTENYPNYLESFDYVFNHNEMYSFNMFVMPWHFFDSYMNWLFTILFELEKKSDIKFEDKYQKRVCAFMAERLQTVWIHHQKLKVKEVPILYFKKSKTSHF